MAGEQGAAVFSEQVEHAENAKAAVAASDILNDLLKKPLRIVRRDDLVGFYLQLKPDAAERKIGDPARRMRVFLSSVEPLFENHSRATSPETDYPEAPDRQWHPRP